jgi:hypothetical protein
MNLTPFLETLRHELGAAAAAGGDDVRALAEQLGSALDSAARLMLLESLAAAAEEISLELAPGAVELRLRGRDPEFVVTPPPEPDLTRDTADDAEMMSPAPRSDDDGAVARFNLRLPESLKERAEAAAAGEGLSLNAWVVRAVAAALEPGAARRSGRSAPSGSDRFTGWVR